MAKFVRKFRPLDYWYIEAYESWLSDMSLQGLHIQKMGARLVKFEKGEPRKREYRIALTPDKDISVAQTALYEENGWEYVTSHQYFHVYTAAEEMRACEVPIDPNVLTSLKKKLTSNLIFPLFGLFVYIGLLVALWLMDGTPILRMVEGAVISQTLLVVVLLTNLFEPVRAIRNIRRLEEHVRVERTLDHHAEWRERWKINRIRSISVVLFALCAAALPFMQLVKSEYGSVHASELELSFIRLAQLESQDELVDDEEDELGWHSVSWSVLAPVQYEVDEYGTVKTDEGEMSVSIETDLYQLRFQAMVMPLMKDLEKWYMYDEAPVFRTESHAYFDHLLVREELSKKELIASNGNIVLYVRYFGEAEMDDLLASAVQVMEEVVRK